MLVVLVADRVFLDGAEVPFTFGQLLDVLAHYVGDVLSLGWACSQDQVEWLQAHGPFNADEWHFVATAPRGIVRVETGSVA